MEENVMIHVLNKFNDENILVTMNYKPKKVIFIRENTQEELEIFRDVKEYLREKIKGIQVEDKTYNDEDGSTIVNAVDEIIENNQIIHLSDMNDSLVMIMLAQRAWKNNLRLLVSDCENERIYEVLSDGSYKVHSCPLNLTVEDLISATGGEIVTDTTKYLSENGFFEYIDWLTSNYSKFKKIKYILRNPNRTTTDIYNKLDIKINLFGLSEEEALAINEHIEIFKRNKMIKVLRVNKGISIEVTAKNDNCKSLFICGGLWLEILTFKTIKEISEIDEIDDLKLGVRFIWNKEVDTVENELDVMFTKDNKLFCISCKDTSNYESAQLNELKVYADQIGGQDSIKALVTTQDPRKITVLDRASEMDISLIMFNGNLAKFRDDLIKLINELF